MVLDCQHLHLHTYNRFNHYLITLKPLYVAINLTLFVINIVSMLYSDLSNCLRSWLNNSNHPPTSGLCSSKKCQDIFTVTVIFRFSLRITVILMIMFRSFRIVIVATLFRQGWNIVFFCSQKLIKIDNFHNS